MVDFREDVVGIKARNENLGDGTWYISCEIERHSRFFDIEQSSGSPHRILGGLAVDRLRYLVWSCTNQYTVNIRKGLETSPRFLVWRGRSDMVPIT